jgi:hypothetical protein
LRFRQFWRNAALEARISLALMNPKRYADSSRPPASPTQRLPPL